MFEKNDIEVVREQRKADGKEKKTIEIVKAVVFPVLLAVIAFCLIFISLGREKKGDDTKTTVLVAAKEIPANSFVTRENAEEYFKEAAIEQASLAGCEMTSFENLPEFFYVEGRMASGEIFYVTDYSVHNAVLDKYKSGYQKTSLGSKDFKGSVNGSLRGGDIVDIYARDIITGELTLMGENIYIERAYDTSGSEISGDDEVAVAFTIFVTDEEVENINRAISSGDIQMYLKTE